MYKNTTHYNPNWLPLRYCKYAATNNPTKVTGIRPNTIPDNNGSTIYIITPVII